MKNDDAKTPPRVKAKAEAAKARAKVAAEHPAPKTAVTDEKELAKGRALRGK